MDNENLEKFLSGIFLEGLNKTNFKKNSKMLIEKILSSISIDEIGTIGIFYQMNSETSNFPLSNGMEPTSSYITYDKFNIEKELLLKYNQSQIFELVLNYNDSDDERKIFSKYLNHLELDILPKELIKLMVTSLKNSTIISFNTKDYKIIA